MGVELITNRTGNVTLINLSDGNDLAYGSVDSSNIFLIGNNHKELIGGEKDDLFIFQQITASPIFIGSINGGDGTNTIDMSKFG